MRLRLHILNDKKVPHMWWRNLRDHCIQVEGKNLLGKSLLSAVQKELDAYSAEIVGASIFGDGFIEFANEQDATMFLLRWS